MEGELRQRSGVSNPVKPEQSTLGASSNGHTGDAREATDGPTRNAGHEDHFGLREIILMALLSLQTGAQPLLIKHCVSKDIIITTQVMACEILKVTVAALVLFLSGSFWREFKNWRPSESLLIAAAPGTIYAVQNSLIQTAYRHVDGVTFNLLNQTKLVSTALCNYVFLRRNQSRAQMFALVLMLAAAVLLTTGSGGMSAQKSWSTDQWTADTFALGIVPLLLGSMTSGLGSTYNQWVVQVRNRSPHVFTVEMCSFSCLLLILNSLLSSDGVRMRTLGPLHGWTPLATIPPLTNALGGILVGLVTKYAGGVRKGFTVIFGLMLSAVLQYFFENTPINPTVLVALPMVVISTYMHAQYPYKPHKTRKD